MEIKKIGSVMKIDEKGFLINEASLDKIDVKWREVVDIAIQVYKDHLGVQLHALYLRGSVPRGRAIEGVSDLDFVAVVAMSAAEFDSCNFDWTKGEAVRIKERYPFQTRVEFYFVPLGAISFTDLFVIQTQAVCVFGKDVFEQYEKVPFDNNTIKKLIEENKIDLKINKIQTLLVKADSVEKIKGHLAWISKRFLRFGVLLAAIKEKRYTRDLYTSYELFAKQYPESDQLMYQALEYSINPVSDMESVLAFIDKLGGRLITEKKNLGLY